MLSKIDLPSKNDDSAAMNRASPNFAWTVWAIRSAYLVIITLLLILIIGPFKPEIIGVASIALMLVLIFSRIHVGIAMVGPGVLGLYSLYGMPAAISMLSKAPYDVTASWEYSVIPMFVLMGLLLWKSGATESLYGVSKRYLSWLPGGLGIGTTIAGAGLAATSGSTVGTVHALGRIGMPEMLKSGYNSSLASGTILMSGLIGQVIPPSVFLVIYAGVAQVPVGPQLLAGIGPGLLMTILFILTVLGFSIAKPKYAGRNIGNSTGLHENQDSSIGKLREVWPVGALMTIVLGGLYAGFFTATEAGAVGAAGALLITVVLLKPRRATGREIIAAVAQTTIATGSIFLLLLGSVILSRLVAVTGLGTGFADWVASANLGVIGFIAIVVVAYLVMGMFMDPLSIIILTVPLLLPIIEEYDISKLWFGVFAVILAELAIVTPPVGILAFIFHDITRDKTVNTGVDVSLGTIFKGVGMFMPAILVLIVVLTTFPLIATWLPSTM